LIEAGIVKYIPKMKKIDLSNYSFYNYSHHDWEELASFCSTYQIFSSNSFDLIPSYLKKLLNRPSYSPQQDLFLVKEKKEIVALLNIWPELRIGRIILNIFICPQHRRRGIATELLRLALKRGTLLQSESFLSWMLMLIIFLREDSLLLGLM